MKFFQERKKKKQLSEFKSRRHAEDDLLSPALRSRFDDVITELENAPLDDLDAVLDKTRQDYAALPLPKRGKLYGFLDLVIVVGAVAFGLRGLFFQPFRIPTGSMQPTLFGVHYQEVSGNANAGFGKVPGFMHSLLYGTTRIREVHQGESGSWMLSTESFAGKIFDYSELFIGNNRYMLPGNARQISDYAKLDERQFIDRGELICDGYMTLGDHLFVERVSMYLAPPERGDILVFNTENLEVDGVPLVHSGGYYYVKRLAALPGDTVKIVDNQLYVRPAGEKEFMKIQDLAEDFKKIYSMQGGYHGHLSDMGSWQFASGVEYEVPEDYYLMLGDNSKFSMDSRYFGPVPRKNLIGRAWLVFYPFSRRVGLVDRQMPLDEATGEAGASAFPAMSHQ